MSGAARLTLCCVSRKGRAEETGIVLAGGQLLFPVSFSLPTRGTVTDSVVPYPFHISAGLPYHSVLCPMLLAVRAPQSACLLC